MCSMQQIPGQSEWIYSCITEGAQGINRAALDRGVDIIATAGTLVHSSCHYYSNSQQTGYTGISGSKKRSIRIAEEVYDNRTDCLCCGTRADFSSKQSHTAISEYIKVKTDVFAETIKKCCKERSDEWSFVVLNRIEYFMCNLHAADCIYHRSCSVNFRTGKTFPIRTSVVQIQRRWK